MQLERCLASGGGGADTSALDALDVARRERRERGVGKNGGPNGARKVGGVMRTQEELERASPRNLRRWGLDSPEAYFACQERRELEKRRLDAFVRDPSTSADDKHHAAAVFHTTFGRAMYNCQKCWLLRGCCICPRLHTSRISPHRVVVYLHHQEWGRGSSTGNLVDACLGGTLFVSGHRDHETALTELCEREKGKVAVLWPGDDAIDARDIGRRMRTTSREAVNDDAVFGNGDGETNGAARGYTFIAVDATWNCARKMLRRLPPDVPLVSIPPEAFNPEYDASATNPAISAPATPVTSLLAPVRKYKGHPDGRCSTFEAVVALLRTLGHPRAECDALLDNVRLTVDAVKVQKSMAPVYDKVSRADDGETRSMEGAMRNLEV